MQLFDRLIRPIKRYGFTYTIKRLYNKLFEGKIQQYSDIIELFKDKDGIEIGGPSEVFRPYSYIPIYNHIKQLDGVNFSNNTIWEGQISSGDNYNYYKNKVGKQYILDATNLSGIDSNKYDFLVSSNCLEHIANPIKAIKEWERIVKPGGHLLILVPNNKFGLDINRNITKFNHILNDFHDNIGEDDLTHLDEVLEKHNLKVDIEAVDFEYFKNRSIDNFNHRTIHHHVFDINSIKELFSYLNFDILLLDDKYAFVTILVKKQY